ncbi:hypothetical protein INT45_008811 [Circinella minor]|uniref:Epoxide hydrolase N-terminal domain-containing protein n=1 Tax=Circinella minor TaxID=1195481 RepID=A0A8H7S2G1_9FUNG|nr:hypothetical protein INT45_008811 [Circinella minor]
MSIEPFEIPSIPSERLALLKERLRNAEYPNELEKDVGWTYGAPRWAVEPLVKAWLNDYDWEKFRSEMNRWHHYKVTIQDLCVHFIHEPSNNPEAIPLLLINGWPSNFYEYHKVIEPLRDGVDRGQAFHVVIPSLPGFGFSEAPKRPGHGVARNAKFLHELMIKLRYTEYVVHGSDWGGSIAKIIAMKYPNECKAFHTVFPLCDPPPLSSVFSNPLTISKYLAYKVFGADAVYGRGKTKIRVSFVDVIFDRDGGYRCIQGTRPYTLAYGLNDSPVGLLAWILEKFHNWAAHPAGKESTEGLPDTITVDEFLTHVTLYWLTKSMPGSTRLYYENWNSTELHDVNSGRVDIPSAVAYFPGENVRLPREWIEANMNIQQFQDYEVGGHFPALESTEVLIDDIQRFGKLLKTNKYIT